VPKFDPNAPSIARVYDYVLGGKDNFPADRELGDRLLRLVPLYAELAIENRQFLARAVTWVADQGIGQFLDLGCGMPTVPNTHESVQEATADARVAYVDNDPVVVNHLTALVAKGNPGVSVVNGDVGDAAAITEAAGAYLDLSAPACVVMGALLHFFAAGDAADLVKAYAAALAPGSYLVVSVLHADSDAADESLKTYSSGVAQVHNHDESNVAAFLSGLDVVPPGLVEARLWRPGWELPRLPLRASKMIVGVARKAASAGLRTRDWHLPP
jgi:SAM-dependent methyltransferase